MHLHEIMENWKSGRFKEWIGMIIETLSESKKPEPLYEKFNDLLLELAWTARQVAEFDERLRAKVYGLSLEILLEMLKILKDK